MATRDDNSDLVTDLGRTRLLTGLSMLFERFWPLALPSLIAASAFFTLSWAGLFRSVPDELRWAFLAVLALLLLVSVWPLGRLRLPGAAEVDARIEAANALKNQPVMAQADRPSGSPDDFANALWREHQRRMAASLEGARPAAPAPRTYDHDRWALRSLPALGLFVAFFYSFGSMGGRVSDIWNGMAAVPAAPPRIDAWVTPPKYTGKPPMFLSGAQPDPVAQLTVPENSELTVRIGDGAQGPFALTINEMPLAMPPAAVDAAKPLVAGQVLKGVLSSDGKVKLAQGASVLMAWDFRIIRDTPPTIEFTADPAPASNGATTLSYAVKDDYGAVKAGANLIADQAPPGARPLYTVPDIALSLPKRGGEGAAKTSKDLTEHPLAGESFSVVLHAEDGAGQGAQSGPRHFVLPEFMLVHPLAKALQEDRRLLARDANAKRQVLDYLDALVIRPDETINNASHYLGIVTARQRLADATSDDELRGVVTYLWEIAREIDRNAMSDAERRLKMAQDKLAQALENGASDQEIEKLMQELRQAMNDYMKQLAEEADKNKDTARNDENTQELRASDLEKMLDKLEDLAKQGSKDQAKQLLNQLNEMMGSLQARKGKGGKDGDAQSQMEGKLNELGKMLRDQQKLLDDTFKKSRRPNGEQDGEDGTSGQNPGEQPGQGQGKGGKGQGQSPSPDGAPGSGDLTQRQNDLSDRLQGMMDGLKGLGLDPGQEFSDAGKAMGRAGKKLGEGNPGEATGDQTDALDSLRKGAESLMNQMKQAMGKQGGGQQPGGQRAGSDQDPLGRPRSTEGPDMGQSTKVPDEIDVQRAREILEAIRRRLGDALSPEAEKNYLERLLQFE